MKPIHLQAKFIGRNGSAGYQHGKTYLIAVEGNRILQSGLRGEVVYESVAAFLNNWTNIKPQ